MVQNISYWMLVYERAFVIKCKGVLRKVVIWYASKIPEPTKENTLEPNVHLLLDIRDKFFEYYDIVSHDKNGRKEMWWAAWKILITEVEHDPHYRNIFFWFLEEIVELTMNGKWQPRPSRHPSGFWKEPRNADGDYGKYHGRAFAKLIKTN